MFGFTGALGGQMDYEQQQRTRGALKTGMASTGGIVAEEAAIQDHGNAAAQEESGLSGGGGAADGALANYQSTLGEYLGGELYGAVSGLLTFEALSGHAQELVDGATGALAGQLGGLDGMQADPAAVQALGVMLAQGVGPAVSAWMAQNGPGLSAALSGWAGANPEAVAGLALMAAAGAVMANVELPTLAKKLNLREGLDAELEVTLGRVRSIALQRIRAQLSYQAGPLLAAVKLDQQGAGTTGEARVGLEEGGVLLEATASFTDQGLQVLGVNAATDTARGRLSGGVQHRSGEAPISSVTLVGQDGETTRTDRVGYDARTGTLTVGREALTALGEGRTLAHRVGAESKGGHQAGVDYSFGSEALDGRVGISTSRDAYQLDEQTRIAAGLNYHVNDLKASLDLALAGAAGTLGGSVARELGEGKRVGGSLQAGFGSAEALSLGAFYGFKDPAAFRQFLVEYQYRSGADEHRLHALLERQWGEAKLRLDGVATAGASAKKVEISGAAAWPIGENTLGVAGITWSRDALLGQDRLKPEIGVQHQGVQVLVGYDAESRSATLRLGIPF